MVYDHTKRKQINTKTKKDDGEIRHKTRHLRVAGRKGFTRNKAGYGYKITVELRNNRSLIDLLAALPKKTEVSSNDK